MKILNRQGEVILENDLANLSGANLSGANLSGANLSGANLSREDLSVADLFRANLYGANLYGADLSRANLYGADLSRANLSRANLSGADLSGANLSGANLSEADLKDIDINENTFGIILNCPEEGSFIAFKKCYGKIVKLLIPEDAKRSSATTYKCRASKAKCLHIEGDLKYIPSDRDINFIYRVGETIEVEDFDDNRWDECSTGIHFFMSKQMAENYS